MSFEMRSGTLAGTDIAIRVRDVGKSYQIYKHPADRLKQMIWRNKQHFDLLTVLAGVNFEIAQGQTVGIVGRNGAGKSTLLQIIAGTLQPSTGSVEVNGRVAPLIELGAGFNPEFNGHDNVMVYGQLLGMDEAEIERKYDDMVRFADIGEYLNRPVKTYSSGMYARLAFAVAMHVDPKILIVDEILAVGDAPFQRKCMRRFYEIKEAGCTILLVAHDHYLIRTLCDEAIYLSEGRMVQFGKAHQVAMRYAEDTETGESYNPLPPPSSPADKTSGAAEPVGAAIVTKIAPAPPPEPAPSEQDRTPAAGPVAAADPRPVATGRLFEIRDVGMFDSGGQATRNIDTGDSITLRFSYHSTTVESENERVTFVFNLKRPDGTYICGATTLMEHHPPYVAGQRGTVSIHFPDLKLLAGMYIWRVAINDHSGIQIHAESVGECSFRVVDSFRADGLFDLNRTWTIVPNSPSPC
jgi:ABC-type polysaccharide/polyol phosphate transport system ATPase subunit